MEREMREVGSEKGERGRRGNEDNGARVCVCLCVDG